MNAQFGRGQVLVGYDGRWQSPSVLIIGAKAAEKLDCPLAIVTLYRTPDDAACLEARPLDGWNPRAAIGRTLQNAERLIREGHPDLRITTYAKCHPEARNDVEPFKSCKLLVLGERHARALETPAIGTASAILREATACNVVVVREPPHESPNVIRLPQEVDVR